MKPTNVMMAMQIAANIIKKRFPNLTVAEINKIASDIVTEIIILFEEKE